jgi:ABC-type transporter Mla MlaB component
VAGIPRPTLAGALPAAPSRAPRGRAGPDDTRGYARGDTITRCDDRGTWLVALHGEHDLATIPLLEEQTCHVWPQCTVAVIDLSEVTFIDSSLIHWLLRVERALEAAHAFTLSIVTGPPDGPAGKLFQRLRMSHVLACYATRRDAFTQAVAAADALAWLATGTDMRRVRAA